MTRSSRCSVNARSASAVSSNCTDTTLVAVHAATPTQTRRPHRSSGHGPSRAPAPARPAWPARPAPQVRPRAAGSPASHPTRPHPRSPTAIPAQPRANLRSSRQPARSASTRIEVRGCNDPSTATAVHDRLCGPTAITTAPDPTPDATPNLLHHSQQELEEITHRLRAKQASLQPLTSTAVTGTQAEEQSTPVRATGVNRATPTTTSEIMAADPISCWH